MNINKIKAICAAFFAGIAASFAAVFLFDRRRKVDGRDTGKEAEDKRRREIEETDSTTLAASSGNADELFRAKDAIKEDTARRVRDRVKAELHSGGA